MLDVCSSNEKFFKIFSLNFCLNFFLVEPGKRRSPDDSGPRGRGERSDSEEKIGEEPETLDNSVGRGRGRTSDSEEQVKEVPIGEFFYFSETSSTDYMD